MTDFILGTAQLGLDYGYTNLTGKPTKEILTHLSDLVDRLGINSLDTASAYGDSESRIGNFFNTKNLNITTKFQIDNAQTKPNFNSHFENLKQSSIHGLIFHKFEDVFAQNAKLYVDALSELQEDGLVKNIGVSIYSESELLEWLRIFPNLNLLQLPANILSMDFLNSSTINQLRSDGVEIQVRSVLLQGILLSEPNSLSSFFDPVKPALSRISELAARNNSSVLEFLLGPIKHHKNVSGVVIGTSSTAELSQLFETWNSCEVESFDLDFTIPERILDPRLWLGE